MDLTEIDSFDISADHLRKVVALTGAGISAESGVPTFRGEGGMWRQHRPEELATPQAFASNPQMVWEWYLYRRQIIAQSNPNAGHDALVELEKVLKDRFILITQNVDGLHRRAGHKNPIELHGNIFLNRCNSCSERYPDDTLDFDKLPPLCLNCQGQIRPDVVWFGEGLNHVTIEDAFLHSQQATLFLSIGTSAVVHPAAALPVVAKDSGALLVEINPDRTPITSLADAVFTDSSAQVLPDLVNKIKQIETKSKN
ncbi:NAD-dependent protein deacylase [candidate division LCP-89 bacterium B3_LCP]|uniref:NAD-dependent protein deacylase n=1 Tax=candidate division LCP-89 bacterium B3_LCP TaxID=2012998 RepID=A0A532UZC2_UNCL8|nr:MAG: NAD-dependent protein deacylase [candidate division LCP-89 bacterium B3_LCP]